MFLLAASDETTAIVAIASGLAGIAGGCIAALVAADATRAAAERQKEASIQTAAQNRFAASQNQKRELYAEFLRLARIASAKDGKDDDLTSQGGRVQMVASKELREKLDPSWTTRSPSPNTTGGVSSWRHSPPT